MSDFGRILIREPAVESPESYGRRVYLLAATYLVLLLGALVGVVLLVWQGQFFVTLTQRSNVETLTLAFFLVFFLYVAVLSAPAARGVALVFWFGLQGLLSRDRSVVEARKVAVLTAASHEGTEAALNVALEREDAPGEPFEIDVRDAAGSMGAVRVDGARVSHVRPRGTGSNDLLGYFVHQVAQLLETRGMRRPIEIVQWKIIEDEAAEQYLSMVQFARNLERQLGAAELWPKVVLKPAEVVELERRLRLVCPALRNESFLPDWEYTAEHKVPVVPEPLGLVSLGRSERRADPVASMGCAAVVVVLAVFVLGLFILFPPWVPGT